MNMEMEEETEMENDELCMTSRSRTPSLFDVKSNHDTVFAQLPDLIQEAIVSTEFSNPRLRISRVPDGQQENMDFMTQPMFYIRPRTDSGVDLPDLNITDEKLLEKYGSDLTANFADIRVYGAKAFFQKRNLSNGSNYSLCTCATGYIWVHVTVLREAASGFDQFSSSEAPDGLDDQFSDIEIQIGTFALKARAITTIEIPCRYKYRGQEDPLDGQLALLCSTVLAKYLRLRMMGQQYEEATEAAIRETRRELHPLRVVNPDRFEKFGLFLREICTNAPMPPMSDVSLISRSMINRRWQLWREASVLRKRFSMLQRAIQCFRKSRHDSTDLLSGYFTALAPQEQKVSIFRT